LDSLLHPRACAAPDFVRLGQDNQPFEARTQEKVLQVEIARGESVPDIHQSYHSRKTVFRPDIEPKFPPPLLSKLTADLCVTVAGQIDQEKGPIDEIEVQGSRLAWRLGDPSQRLSEEPVEKA
jgi:hypothetical protein